MDARLRSSAEEGDTNALYKCIRQHPHVLRGFDEVESVETPLHIAAARGHADFAIAILNLKPSFGRKLNQDFYSAIHLALQNEHETTMFRLIEADRDLVRVKGKGGYTVLHQAAERGNLQLLAQFLKHCPSSIEDVTIRNETALHIAAKNYRLEAVELLAQWLRRSHLYSGVSRKYLFDSKDTYGNTVLHIAAFPIQTQMMKILVECGADRKVTTTNGMTAVDIIKNQSTNTRDKATSLKILQSNVGVNCFRLTKPLNEIFRSKINIGELILIGLKLPLLKLSAESINALLVAFSLILTTSFQAFNSPPGGVWQGDASKANSVDDNYMYIGTSILSLSNHYVFFMLNLLAFAFAVIFAIALIQFLAAGSFIMILYELLLSSFICCFLFAGNVIDPSGGMELGGTGELLLIYFVVMFVLMEILRRLFSSGFGIQNQMRYFC